MTQQTLDSPSVTDQKPINPKDHIQPDWYLTLSRGVGGGQWESVCKCEACGLHGAPIYHLSSYRVCPRCGENKVNERTGRFVTTHITFWGSRRGYWSLKTTNTGTKS